MVNWKEIRDSVSATHNRVYLASAATGPLHPAAAKRMSEFQQSLTEGADAYWPEFEAEISQVRNDVAEFLNAKPHEITFTTSTSLAMNFFAMILKSRSPTPKQLSILSMRDEFPSSTLPWLHHGFSVDFAQSENGAYIESILERQLKLEHRILVSSHIQFATGFRQDLQTLNRFSKNHDLTSVLNVTQSLGAFPVDASLFDFVSGSVHKWMMAGYGVSVCKISEKYLSNPLPIHGWLSESNPEARTNDRVSRIEHEARALEVGTMPLMQIFAVGAVVRWIKDIGGIQKISDRILNLAEEAQAKLRSAGLQLAYDFPSESNSGILIVQCADPQRVAGQLAKYKIHVSPRGKGIRLSLHFFNDSRDIDRFIEAFKSLA